MLVKRGTEEMQKVVNYQTELESRREDVFQVHSHSLLDGPMTALFCSAVKLMKEDRPKGARAQGGFSSYMLKSVLQFQNRFFSDDLQACTLRSVACLLCSQPKSLTLGRLKSYHPLLCLCPKRKESVELKRLFAPRDFHKAQWPS